jgi:cytochrome c-type biogenesis protein CcmH
MTWVFVIALVVAVFVLIAFVLKAPRPAWEIVGAALLLGVAGYALQGSPGEPGAPKEPVEKIAGAAADASVVERQKMSDSPAMGDSHLVIADALARHGQFADAAEVLRGAVEKNPHNSDAWLAMGNALVGHAEGNITPAAFYAYSKAAVAEPRNPGPPFFLGLALIQSGRLAEGRLLWADLLARSPKDAPWRADLQGRLGELDAFMARQQGVLEATP